MENKKNLKILITQIGHPNFRGGGNTVAHNLSELFAKRGHDVTTIYLSPKNLLLNKPKATYNIMLKKTSIVPIFNCIKAAMMMKKVINTQGEPDVIINLGYEGLFTTYIKGKAVFIAASHVFLQYVGLRDLFLNYKWLNPFNFGKWLFASSFFIDRLTKLHADFVQCVSNSNAEQCKTIFKISENKIFVVPNGVAKKSIRSMSQNNIILFVGGSVEYKGLDILIKAMPSVIEKHLDVHLIVLGEMKERKHKLNNLAEKLNVNKKIDWRGLVSPSKVFEFYNESYMVVFPSRVESFLLAAIEAMSIGVPVITTKIGIMPEIINDKVNGLIIKDEDSVDLAKAIVYLLDNPQKAGEIGRQGKITVDNEFLWEKVIEKYEKEIYSRLNNSKT